MPFDLIEASKKLVGIRSVTTEGTVAAVRFLVPFCERLGFFRTLQASGNGFGAAEMNLIAHTVPEGSADLCPGGLALVTHLDTVPPGDPALWTKTGGDPLRATIRGDRLYGLGSADTKLDFLCKLKAVENIVGARRKTPLHEIFRVPVALIGTFGEERALAGIRLLQESGLIHPRMALVGEPSRLQPVIGHKGILYMRAVWEGKGERGDGGTEKKIFTGKAAHGSTPHLGKNAILKALDWILKKPKKKILSIQGGSVHNIVPDRCEVGFEEAASPDPSVAFLREFSGLMKKADAALATHKNRSFDPPITTSNVGVIRGDAGRIEIEFDFRLIPETDGNELFEIFRSLERLVPRARAEVIRSNPPMNTPRESTIAKEVERALRRLRLPVRFGIKAGNTEGAILNAMGAETIVIGPGRSTGNIHAPNEYNEISQLKKAVAFYEAFLRQFC